MLFDLAIFILLLVGMSGLVGNTYSGLGKMERMQRAMDSGLRKMDRMQKTMDEMNQEIKDLKDNRNT